MLRILFALTLAGIVALWWISSSDDDYRVTSGANSEETDTSPSGPKRSRVVPVARPSIGSTSDETSAEPDRAVTTDETLEKLEPTPANVQFDEAIDGRAVDAGRESRLRSSLLSGILDLGIDGQATIEAVECSDELCRVSLAFTEGNHASELLNRLLSLEPLRGEVFATRPDLDGKQNIYVAHGGLALSERLAMNRP